MNPPPPSPVILVRASRICTFLGGASKFPAASVVKEVTSFLFLRRNHRVYSSFLSLNTAITPSRPQVPQVRISPLQPSQVGYNLPQENPVIQLILSSGILSLFYRAPLLFLALPRSQSPIFSSPDPPFALWLYGHRNLDCLEPSRIFLPAYPMRGIFVAAPPVFRVGENRPPRESFSFQTPSALVY